MPARIPVSMEPEIKNRIHLGFLSIPNEIGMPVISLNSGMRKLTISIAREVAIKVNIRVSPIN